MNDIIIICIGGSRGVPIIFFTVYGIFSAIYSEISCEKIFEYVAYVHGCFIAGILYARAARLATTLDITFNDLPARHVL